MFNGLKAILSDRAGTTRTHTMRSRLAAAFVALLAMTTVAVVDAQPAHASGSWSGGGYASLYYDNSCLGPSGVNPCYGARVSWGVELVQFGVRHSYTNSTCVNGYESKAVDAGYFINSSNYKYVAPSWVEDYPTNFCDYS